MFNTLWGRFPPRPFPDHDNRNWKKPERAGKLCIMFRFKVQAWCSFKRLYHIFESRRQAGCHPETVDRLQYQSYRHRIVYLQEICRLRPSEQFHALWSHWGKWWQPKRWQSRGGSWRLSKSRDIMIRDRGSSWSLRWRFEIGSRWWKLKVDWRRSVNSGWMDWRRKRSRSAKC